ncbi:sensor histidine kinase [Mucilaginibacter sp. UR6-11]|uniref:sensor histidine kinase n=1 Tax=Mucilaginibacter sp. UR6-11 TaxID=1435644 RepID=UPI001E577F18|nr:histidine kinase [Mucilaginibacter sp. UR6-11]MCC8424280.1 histidine kinase [Mucilaginibacter sp. UR6-11]
MYHRRDDQKEARNQDPFLHYLVDRPYSIYRRAAFVIILLILLEGGNEQHQYAEDIFLYLKLGGLLIILSLIALNMYVLIPRFLFKGLYKTYFIWVIGGIMISFLVFVRIRAWLPSLRLSALPSKTVNNTGDFLAYVVLLCILCAATAGVKLFQRWVKDRYRLTQLENMRIHTELDLLKSNVSPHFLFNMLNGSEVLIRTEPEKASQMLINLSDLLRYQLYDSSREQVLLSAEIRFLQDFLSLEKIRRDFFEFSIGETGTDRPQMVPPLLFIPFVENAVKHNIQSEAGAYVWLDFVLTATELVFTCTNSKGVQQATEPGGLGLPNVRRRLELLFPGRHSLEIHNNPDNYTIKLTLNL